MNTNQQYISDDDLDFLDNFLLDRIDENADTEGKVVKNIKNVVYTKANNPLYFRRWNIEFDNENKLARL